MVDYKCGHKTDGVIILDDNLLSMSAYLDWVSSVGLNGDKSQCWECYCKRDTQENKQVNSQESPRASLEVANGVFNRKIHPDINSNEKITISSDGGPRKGMSEFGKKNE